jgi:addiction module HigA family antidote
VVAAQASSAFGSMTNFESALNGKRKDRPMSQSPITTENRLPRIHPGRILLEDLKDEQISINGLAKAIRVPPNRISLIVNEKRGITADTAARLGRYFGTSPQYWLNRIASISTPSIMP